MNRRSFLKSAGASVLFAGGRLAGARAALAQTAPGPLPLISMTDLTGGITERIPLHLKVGRHDFGNGVLSDTFGINQEYLGPVLRVKQGQTLPFDVQNSIADTSTLHWHGLHIPGDVDGGPHQEIEQDGLWSPDVPIVQHASMNWFHSHMHGKTARQTYTGLAGVLLVEDDASLSADLPKTYGVDDFTLVLQDKMFGGDGKMSYELSGEVFEDGFEADTLVINGAIAPVAQEVPTGLIRLRILNACNARFLTLSMATGPVTVIASDGGFLSAPVETAEILMSPGERYEILVDMGQAERNALNVAYDEGGLGFLANLFGGSQTLTALILQRSSQKGFTGSMPKQLANLAPPRPYDATVTRSFELQMDVGADLAALALAWDNFCGNAGAMAINGLPMQMERIDEEVRKGDTEIWRISVDDQLHPFHIHGCSFRILTQNGAPAPAYAQGWKDMVHVEEGWSEVLVQFDHTAPADAPYMYHCHILEHEDCGMMGQFTVS
ncbi:multicopper oxidase domain-containing protein [Shimia marina]|uniref:Multicopper oxidase CueO n=1 Tax=Shimia marina TaxID=321267 RepID=A0A0P1FC81_9RHOB|nr:multicopper oxidase domain-containing protein [Shimia marina]CUH53278.1 Copper efflux oxidase [Shimia marina]SFD80904.1 Multicopper oxidase with three cupredoxin domains (includes cell division protein FtsP and spore coat protein CotA) [Shimia marina]